VSRKVTPPSAARSRMAREVSSSARDPNHAVPRQSRETFRPVCPRRTCSIASSSVGDARSDRARWDPPGGDIVAPEATRWALDQPGCGDLREGPEDRARFDGRYYGTDAEVRVAAHPVRTG